MYFFNRYLTIIITIYYLNFTHFKVGISLDLSIIIVLLYVIIPQIKISLTKKILVLIVFCYGDSFNKFYWKKNTILTKMINVFDNFYGSHFQKCLFPKFDFTVFVALPINTKH